MKRIAMAILYDYAGVIHIHSAYSFDGRTPVPDIVEAAKKNRLDFLMLTDHSNLRAKEEGLEGWHGDTLLIVGQEIAPRFNHYLAFGINSPVLVPEGGLDNDPQAYIDQVRNQGGIGFIAHPDHEGTDLFHVKHYPWLDWEVTGYAGFGIWDFMTDWQSSLNGYFTALACYFFPAFFLKGPKPETLRRWDKMNRDARVVGIGELDNHYTVRKIIGFNFCIFPFMKALKFLRTHILTEEPLQRDNERDIASLLSALKRGRAYMAGEYYQDASGFSFSITDNGQEATMGDEYILCGPAQLNVRTPVIGRIRIIKDSLLFHEEITRNAECRIIHPGLYRVEVHMKVMGKYLPWIFSNPVHVNLPGHDIGREHTGELSHA